MLQEEHSALHVLSTFIKLPISIKTFVCIFLSGCLRQVCLYKGITLSLFKRTFCQVFLAVGHNLHFHPFIENIHVVLILSQSTGDIEFFVVIQYVLQIYIDNLLLATY